VKGSTKEIKRRLGKLYNLYNYRKWVHPDPLEFLYQYADIKDREVVGLIASSLAYGRVTQILKSVSSLLTIMGPSPHDFLQSTSLKSLGPHFREFKYRFTTGEELLALLAGLKQVMKEYGSLYNCFLCGFNNDDETVYPALSFMVKELTGNPMQPANSLLPLPERGSACKRLNLFLRWMVRKDRVDPGGWRKVSPAKLIIPLDTHMHRIGLQMGFTGRRHGGMKTAIDITHAFRDIAPEDPVRYDFALTRLGIRKDSGMSAFFE
jgi:uncharacterized protein (TIGR02757 family)